MANLYDGTEEYYHSELEPAPAEPAEKIEPWRETKIVGKSLPRIDAYDRVSGAAPRYLLRPVTRWRG